MSANLDPVEYVANTLEREDILNLISSSEGERDLINDIIDCVESNIVKQARTLVTVSLPYIGSLSLNEPKVDAMENNGFLRDRRKEMDEPSFQSFKKAFIHSRYVQRNNLRSFTIVTSRAVNNNPKRFNRLKSLGWSEEKILTYFYYLAQCKVIDDNGTC